MDNLDRKPNDAFPGFVVRKDLVKLVRGDAAVPSHVFKDVEKRIQQQIGDDGLRTCCVARYSISSELVTHSHHATVSEKFIFVERSLGQLLSRCASSRPGQRRRSSGL
jgi:ATP-dependent Lon protease